MLVHTSIHQYPGVVYRTEVVRRFGPPDRGLPAGRQLTATSTRRPAMARPNTIHREAVLPASPNRRRTAISPTPRSRHGTSSRPRWINRPSMSRRCPHNTELITQLREMAQLLRAVYSACVTAELALQGQNADHDHDILRTLRMHVSEPVSRQVEKLETLVVDLSGSPSTGSA